MDYSKLHGRIVEKYGNVSRFAKNINTSQSAVSLKLSGRRDFCSKDIVLYCEALEIPPDEIGLYFFSRRVAL